MVRHGTLVREDCSVESKARLGTVVKVTELVLHENSQWKSELDRWIHRFGADTEGCFVIRPAKVASVRWQDDPKKITVHVFYNDCPTRSYYSTEGNSIELVDQSSPDSSAG